MRRLLVPAALAALSLGCAHELPEAPSGAVVEGTVYYDGEQHLDYSEPGLIVAAFAEFPPTGPPHASMTIANPDFTVGVGYRLEQLQPYNYYLVAQLFDFADEDALSGPAGSHPDACSMVASTGPTIIEADDHLEHHITLYDGAGNNDPCYAPSFDTCPVAGSASLAATIVTGPHAADLDESDQLVIGIFREWPPASPPVSFAIRTREQISESTIVVLNDVLPGDYVVYSCLDIGGNNLMGVCGDEDRWTVAGDNDPIAFAPETVVSVTHDLVEEIASSPVISTADELGCGGTVGGLAELVVELDAVEELEAGPDDAVHVSIHASREETGPAIATASVAVTELPVDVRLQDLTPGARAVSVCFDTAGDNDGDNCDGPGDFRLWYQNGELVTLVAEETSTISMVLAVPLPLVVTVESALVAPTMGDTIAVALFDAFPPTGPPQYARSVDLQTFPVVLSMEDAPAGEWYLSVCYDLGGDSPDCSGDGDLVLWYEDGAQTLVVDPAGEPALLTLSLDSIDATLSLTLDSQNVSPVSPDMVAASIFSTFPPSIPSGFVIEDATGFPTVLTVTGITPGEWYVAGCYDRGGDNLTCDGAGDILVWYMDAATPARFAPGEALEIALSLD